MPTFSATDRNRQFTIDATFSWKMKYTSEKLKSNAEEQEKIRDTCHSPFRHTRCNILRLIYFINIYRFTIEKYIDKYSMYTLTAS